MATLPTLVGRISAGVISGVWGMTQQAAHSGDASRTSKFEYKYNLEVSGQPAPQSGGYSGYFWLQVPGRTTPIKVVDNEMHLGFSQNAAGRLNVHGQGENRYGPFTISGTCDTNGLNLELTRVYTQKLSSTKPKTLLPTTIRKSSGKDLNRVQAVLKKSHEPSEISSLSAIPSSDDAFADSEGKRSARARKAPLYLRHGTAVDLHSGNPQAELATTEALKRCHAILASLERSAIAEWFSAPVDAIALGVPHYGAIIYSPMDLGTIKRGLDHGLYSDPHVFAADVRLVFRNAMTFNVLPEAPVHEAARDLHARLEDQLKNLWKHLAGSTLAGAKGKLGGLKREADVDLDSSTSKRGKAAHGKGSGKKSGSSKKTSPDDDFPAISSRSGMVPVADLVDMQRQMESMQATIAALQKQASQTEVQVQMNMELGVGGAAPAYSVLRPPHMAKPLTFAEKEALSDDINALPPERLAHVVKIVQDSMPLTGRHDDDEIEVDIETLDNDTLRHLQKYVKGSLRKKRAGARKKGEQANPSAPDLLLTSDERTLASVALGGTDLGSGFESEEDDGELTYDVLAA